MKTIWRDIKTDPPAGTEYAVLLFPVRSDCGVLYTVSNSQYAKSDYARERYTHWAEFELAPTHAELQLWQDQLTAEDIEKSLQGAIEFLDSLNDQTLPVAADITKDKPLTRY
jgi:hypothetical protein